MVYYPPEETGKLLLRYKKWCLIDKPDTIKRYYIGHIHTKRVSRKAYPFYMWFYYADTRCRSCKARAPLPIRTLFKLLNL